jgi:hypothetical protein
MLRRLGREAAHVQRERAGAHGGCGFEFNERDAHFGGHGNGRTVRTFFNDQGFGVQVIQVELEFICTVAGVQGR